MFTNVCVSVTDLAAADYFTVRYETRNLTYGAKQSVEFDIAKHNGPLCNLLQDSLDDWFAIIDIVTGNKSGCARSIFDHVDMVALCGPGDDQRRMSTLKTVYYIDAYVNSFRHDEFVITNKHGVVLDSSDDHPSTLSIGVSIGDGMVTAREYASNSFLLYFDSPYHNGRLRSFLEKVFADGDDMSTKNVSDLLRQVAFTPDD